MKFQVIFTFFLILLYQISCKKTSRKETVITKDSITTKFYPIKDSLDLNNQNNFNDLRIYPMGSYAKTEGKDMGFISLTDDFYFDDHKNTPVIAKEYLGIQDFKEFHILDKIHRDRFLKISNIKESDTVFIYNYSEDQLSTFMVKDLPLMAHITVYGGGDEIVPSDYLIGFDLSFDKKFSYDDNPIFYQSFVSIGDRNPFTKGKMKPVIWKSISPKNLPKEIKVANAEIKKLFRYKMDDRIYYLLNDNHLIILNSKTRTIMYDYSYVEDEGSSVSPAIMEGQKIEYDYTQWTGQLFKDKPPVVFGFMYGSFGCESINFIDKTEKSIYILCDNRH